MAYEKTTWANGSTALSSENMNHIENGIADVDTRTTTAETKLSTIETGAEVNQNAFATVVGCYQGTQGTAINASDPSDTLRIAAGNNMGYEVDLTKKQIKLNCYWPTIASPSNNGLMSAADKTKLDGIQEGAQANRTYTAVSGYPTSNAAPGFGQTAAVSQVSQDENGQITLTHRTITIPNKVATTAAPGLMSAADKIKLNGIDVVTQSEAGLMSAADKIKLDGIQEGAEANVQSDWNQTNASADDYIKNKPTFGSYTIYPSGNINVPANSSNTVRFKSVNSEVRLLGIIEIKLKEGSGTVTVCRSLSITGYSVTSDGFIDVYVRNSTDESIVVSSLSQLTYSYVRETS